MPAHVRKDPVAKTTMGASDEALIRAAIDEWTKAVRAKHADGVLRHYAPDIVSFDLAPPLKLEGADRKGLEAWFATWKGGIEFDVTDLSIAADSELAFARSLNRVGGIKTDGKASSVWVRSTVCFRKMAGAWKVVHTHVSVPFYMDGSVRAAVDLKP